MDSLHGTVAGRCVRALPQCFVGVKGFRVIYYIYITSNPYKGQMALSLYNIVRLHAVMSIRSVADVCAGEQHPPLPFAACSST